MKHPSILVVNAGSSSIKCSLFACPDRPMSASELQTLYRANITGLGTNSPHFSLADMQGNKLVDQVLPTNQHEGAFAILLDWLEQKDDGFDLMIAGHRIVHGSTHFTAPVLVTPDVITLLESFTPLAPLHQPHNVAGIKTLFHLKSQLTQVACFDTAFHTTQPPVAQTFALPREMMTKGIRRYGFHGLSYEYIAHVLPQFVGTLPERVIVGHLGNGVSLCALHRGHSIATTMGFSTLDGLPMGTRCGTLDAGLILHLLQDGMNVKELSDILYHRSGLLGVSGISSDMRELLASDSPHAAEAINLFAYQIRGAIGSLTAALGGLDALVFTAGIGEYATPIRTRICQGLGWLGIEIDEAANAQHQPKISTSDSRISVWVIPTNEEKMIAHHSYHLTQASG